MWIADAGAMKEALSLTPIYLRTKTNGEGKGPGQCERAMGGGSAGHLGCKPRSQQASAAATP